MRSRLVLLTLTVYLSFAVLACTKKADTPDNSGGTAATDSSGNPTSNDAQGKAAGGSMAAPTPERKERQEAKEVKRNRLSCQRHGDHDQPGFVVRLRAERRRVNRSRVRWRKT